MEASASVGSIVYEWMRVLIMELLMGTARKGKQYQNTFASYV